MESKLRARVNFSLLGKSYVQGQMLETTDFRPDVLEKLVRNKRVEYVNDEFVKVEHELPIVSTAKPTMFAVTTGEPQELAISRQEKENGEFDTNN